MERFDGFLGFPSEMQNNIFLNMWACVLLSKVKCYIFQNNLLNVQQTEISV